MLLTLRGIETHFSWLTITFNYCDSTTQLAENVSRIGGNTKLLIVAKVAISCWALRERLCVELSAQMVPRPFEKGGGKSYYDLNGCVRLMEE